MTTPYPEMRRLVREIESTTSSQDLEAAANHALFKSRILRSIPEAKPRRRFLILTARAYRSLLRERGS